MPAVSNYSDFIYTLVLILQEPRRPRPVLLADTDRIEALPRRLLQRFSRAIQVGSMKAIVIPLFTD